MPRSFARAQAHWKSALRHPCSHSVTLLDVWRGNVSVGNLRQNEKMNLETSIDGMRSNDEGARMNRFKGGRANRVLLGDTELREQPAPRKPLLLDGASSQEELSSLSAFELFHCSHMCRARLSRKVCPEGTSIGIGVLCLGASIRLWLPELLRLADLTKTFEDARELVAAAAGTFVVPPKYSRDGKRASFWRLARAEGAAPSWSTFDPAATG